MMNEDKLTAASASVTEWQGRIRTITDKIAKAAAALAESKRTRNEHVLAAAMGDHDVRKQLDHVLEEDRKAELDLELLRASLQIAEAELASAEQARKVAETEFRKAEVLRLARERVDAAAAIDKALADFSKAFANYEALGKELFNAAADDHAGNIHSFTESVDGMLRLAANLPHEPFYSLRWRYSFAPIGTSSSLAIAEAQYWRLPPAEEVKAA
jgi:hypothetical protein